MELEPITWANAVLCKQLIKDLGQLCFKNSFSFLT